MEKNPVFSIISVTLNNCGGLEKTANSLKFQSFRDFEWLVVDGGSKDGTMDYLRNSDALWTSAPDDGIYDAMNKGLKRARGDYVLFLNAGDRLAFANTLSRIHNLILAEKNPPDFIYGDSREAEAYKPARSPERFKLGMFTHHQAMLYRREALHGLRYDTGYKIAADYDFTVRMLQHGGSILYYPLPVCVFEQGGVSQVQAGLGRREQFRVRRALKLCSIFENVSIYLAQAASWNMRRLVPRLYWRVKSSGNKRPGFAQT